MDELDRDESDNANSTDLEKYSQPIRIIMEQPSARQQQIMAMDVYGQQIEPICNYRTCHHKFLVHGHNTRRCKCRHALNYATGVSMRRDYMICN